jgi:hypothetical protein
MVKRTTMSEQQLANTKDIAYLQAQVDSIEKTLDNHRKESKEEKEQILTKLDDIGKTVSMWRHTIWLGKAFALTVLGVIGFKGSDAILDIWK